MRRSLVLLALLLAACANLTPSVDGAGGASASTGAGGSASTPCTGFKDITGACLDPTCLQTSACTAETAMEVCGPGVSGDGTCFAGVCMYENHAQGCNAPADCPCGLCGADGHCYEDRGNSCGSCTGAAPKGKGDGSPACTSCLAACAGTGPSCCAGCGCACEGECGAGC